VAPERRFGLRGLPVGHHRCRLNPDYSAHLGGLSGEMSAKSPKNDGPYGISWPGAKMGSSRVLIAQEMGPLGPLGVRRFTLNL
jgi:hypothetical protein